ncbi:translation initiation factor IF-2 N-terminal domain-containing protein [Amylolactobacillus amylophilus]|uniref:translation initiation factor IF-2 N-terminal domain-containing protein n=1 Tax=Amylolactobacillus amylophilus TaxID=1603 RepID=UPI000ACAA0E8
MTKVRIYELAKELGVENKVVVDQAKALGFDVKSHMSSLDTDQEKTIMSKLGKKPAAKKTAPKPVEKPATKPASTAKPASTPKKADDGKVKISVSSMRRAIISLRKVVLIITGQIITKVEIAATTKVRDEIIRIVKAKVVVTKRTRETTTNRLHQYALIMPQST